MHQHFDAFLDIDWDHPDFAIDPDDARWMLPERRARPRTRGTRRCPRSEQIRIGIYRQANISKVGLQFEQILIGGLMNYARTLPNGSPEFRYATHEATEECHHTQMFQEFVNRSGVDVPGGSRFFRARRARPAAGGALVPFGFFTGVLAGEEPIDHVQKAVLRAGDDMHPLLQRIMQIHVAEEARHIGFAHQYLEHNAPRLSRHRALAALGRRSRSSCAGSATRSSCRASRPGRTWASRRRWSRSSTGTARVAEDAARPVRRRADARRGHSA